MTKMSSRAWIGVDIGKTHHWVCAVDEAGKKLLLRKVLNDEAQILEVMDVVNRLAPDGCGPSTSSARPQHCW